MQPCKVPPASPTPPLSHSHSGSPQRTPESYRCASTPLLAHTPDSVPPPTVQSIHIGNCDEVSYIHSEFTFFMLLPPASLPCMACCTFYSCYSYKNKVRQTEHTQDNGSSVHLRLVDGQTFSLIIISCHLRSLHSSFFLYTDILIHCTCHHARHQMYF